MHAWDTKSMLHEQSYACITLSPASLSMTWYAFPPSDYVFSVLNDMKLGRAAANLAIPTTSHLHSKAAICQPGVKGQAQCHLPAAGWRQANRTYTNHPWLFSIMRQS